MSKTLPYQDVLNEIEKEIIEIVSKEQGQNLITLSVCVNALSMMEFDSPRKCQEVVTTLEKLVATGVLKGKIELQAKKMLSELSEQIELSKVAC